ncbi:MAG: hypothetical protein HN704_02360 [Bacteroidetes bacterium]|jgi:hypothetical protein|nr:hypothetical protein [Bacteroidota bacterium]MBT6686383.1 hypothetical protein [Bacteroidota bacterium]MBT7142216.1 hypothetical protein [Bacteroidota bacterium]MBT7490429.1 hypothetical protein [Bacteroidota bacterium]
MKNEYSLKIDNDLKIFRYRHQGYIDKNDIGIAWEELLSKEEFTKQKYNLLSDYRNAMFDSEIDDVDLISDFLYKIKDILKGKKQAIIINDPLSAALSVLFGNQVNKRIG